MTVWSFVVALVIGFLVKFTIGLRVKEEHEVEGIDTHQHKETAYESSTGDGSSGDGPGAHAAQPPQTAGV